MDSNQFNHTPKFVELLNSQQDNFFCFLEDSAQLSSSKLPVFGTQGTEASSAKEDTPAEHRERRIWTPVDDVVLISSWLNTRKDLLVGNEKRSGTFWKRIASYFAASPKVAGCGQREASNYKQRWQKINDQVNKFCGSYEAATREKSIGQNENDILKRAHEIFFSNHKKKKITPEHAWKELRNDQKWCELSCSSKRRKCEDGSQSATSHTNETKSVDDRPPGCQGSKE